ncbi:MAG: hypothetical protein JKY96_00550 [Phycisphaerales bacterium]|nr:hypothetical protein [Phycisphaerales bacterium]
MKISAKLCTLALTMAAGIALTPSNALALPPETAISYQGVLAQNGTPVTGMRDFRFRLYDDAVAGNLIDTLQLFNVDLVDGLFSVELDWGVQPWVLNDQLWLEIEAGPADGSQSYEIITRQKLSAVPYALNTRGINVGPTGNVGIGTAAAANGALEVRGDDPQPLRVTSPTSAGIRLETDGTPSSWTIYHELSSDNLNFRDSNDGITRMAIRGDTGFVGMGTAIPHRPLVVARSSGSSYISVNAPVATGVLFGTSETATNGGVLYNADIADGLSFRTLSNMTRMVVSSSGSVGIGTTSPASRLDVRYSAGNGIEVTDTNAVSSSIGIQSTVGAGTGVRGESTAASGSTFGVYGQVASTAGWGVFSNGRLGSSGTKSFMIDHPLDPMGSYLLHYSSESPEPQNRYNGNVFLDNRGRAVIVLPDYFSSINTDHRYTLTPIGAPAPNLYIETEIQGNTFVIAGGVPLQKISWEVISKRSDAFVQQRGAPIELQKIGPDRGRLLMPSLYGQPETMGIHYKAPASKN